MDGIAEGFLGAFGLWQVCLSKSDCWILSMEDWEAVGIILVAVAGLALVVFVIMATWGCQPGNIHLQGMCG